MGIEKIKIRYFNTLDISTGKPPPKGGGLLTMLKKNSLTIRPEDCRKRAEELSRENMARNYLTLYQKILNGNEW